MLSELSSAMMSSHAAAYPSIPRNNNNQLVRGGGSVGVLRPLSRGSRLREAGENEGSVISRLGWSRDGCSAPLSITALIGRRRERDVFIIRQVATLTPMGTSALCQRPGVNHEPALQAINLPRAGWLALVHMKTS